MNKPAKQFILYKELLEKVRNILVAYAECRNIHIDGIDLYQEQVNGANWDITRYRRSGDDNDWTECREKIDKEIRQLRDCYDVVKDD